MDLKTTIVVCTPEFLPKYLEVVECLDEDARPKLFVMHSTETPANNNKRWRCFDDFCKDDGDDLPKETSLKAYNSQSPLAVLWTAGTTGSPKGILHCHQTLHNVGYLKNICNTSLITNVAYHMAGFLHHLATGILGRTTSYFIKEQDFSGNSYLNALESYQIEYFVCSVASFTSILNARSLNTKLNLKIVTPIGGTLSPSTVTKVMGILGSSVRCVKIYGGTELGFIAKGLFDQDYTNIGLLSPGAQIYIADLNTKTPVGPNNKGIMMVKTRNMMLGYVKEMDNIESFDGQGFVNTGDVGFYDNEGNVHLVYRKKDVLKV